MTTGRAVACSTKIFGFILLGLASTSWAQTEPSADATGPETVVVTGIRHSIEDSIALKRNSSSIVEVISAEDIGKLPDTSIADSISRLPGITSQRAEGRASAISLRGTDPGFTTALLNGREQVSTGDNRSIEFDQYPSELLSAVVVYKTPDAQLVGQGLAGTIDLRTVRPLEYGQRAMAFNIRAEQNSHDEIGADSDDQGYRASFSYIGQFMEDQLGIAFGYAHLESPLATEGAGVYEPWQEENDRQAQPGVIYNPGVDPDNFVTNGIKVRTDMGQNKRDGAMAVVQFRPTDRFSSTLDAYYTTREQENNARSLEVNLSGYPGPCCDGNYAPGTVAGFSDPVIVDNTVVGGTLNLMVPLARNFLFKTEDEIVAGGWLNQWEGELWTFSADVSYSYATRDEEQYETNAQYVPLSGQPPGTPVQQYDTGTFQVTSDNMPSVTFNRDYGDPALVQVGPTIYGAGYSKIPYVTDELTSGRIDVMRNFDNWFSAIGAGVNYSDRTKDKYQPEGGLSTIGNGYFQISPENLLAPTNLSYGGAGNVLAWDVLGVLRDNYNPIVYGTPETLTYLIGKNWIVNEKIGTVYVKGNLDHQLSESVTLRGNIGVQYVDTDQSSDALYLDTTTDPDTVVPFTDGKTYSDVLPMINLAFLLPNDQAVRVGLAKEIARARMDQLKASSEFGYDSATGIPGGSGGNPQLDPWRANAFDLSYEKYFGRNAYVSIAGFYKDLESYIYNQTNGSYDYSEFLATLPPGYFAPGVVPQTTGNFSQPVNGSGGKLQGLELAVSLTGEVFTDALTGFGAIFSIAQTDSNITIQDPPGNNYLTGTGLGEIPLPGLSETVWNATLYYEGYGFSARVATRARSEYIGEITNFANDRAFRYIKGDQITDAQVGYEFGEGVLQGLSILLQVNNITDEPYIAYAVNETRQQDYQEYGRQYLLGVNYRL